MTYPPYTITSAILKRVAGISEQLAALAAVRGLAVELLSPHLRRENRIRTIHASLAIENNTLSLEQVTDIINGKAVIGPPRDIQEVHGAVSAYEKLDTWQPHKLDDMLSAHAILMRDLVEKPGSLRTGGVGVFQGNRVVHMAPPAHLVHEHLKKLLGWLEKTDEHPLVSSCVFHYEFEFIHPFVRTGMVEWGVFGRRLSSANGIPSSPTCRWKPLSATGKPNIMTASAVPTLREKQQSLWSLCSQPWAISEAIK